LLFKRKNNCEFGILCFLSGFFGSFNFSSSFISKEFQIHSNSLESLFGSFKSISNFILFVFGFIASLDFSIEILSVVLDLLVLLNNSLDLCVITSFESGKYFGLDSILILEGKSLSLFTLSLFFGLGRVLCSGGGWVGFSLSSLGICEFLLHNSNLTFQSTSPGLEFGVFLVLTKF
jgi:hypothetical protein